MLSPLPFGILSFLSAAAAAPAPAPEAPPKPTIAVVGLHQDSLDAADQDRAIAGLVAAIDNGGRFDGRNTAEVALAVRGREAVVLEEGLLKGARQSLANGRTANAQANWDEARSWLASAIQDFERAMSGANTTQELWEAEVLLGATWLLQDVPDEEAARREFTNAIALAPQRPPDPAQFPPTVTDVYAALQADLADELVALPVSASGPATLWVDGAERGALPTTIPDLRPGVHYVLARGEGQQASARLDLARGAPVDALTLTIGPASLGQPSDTSANKATQISGLYSALGKRSQNLQYVLVGGVEGGVLHLQFFDTARGVFSKSVDLPFSGDCDDEAIAAVPLLLPIIGPDGAFTATAASPSALSIAENVALARLLTQPPAVPVAVPDPVGPGPVGPTPKKSKVGLVLGIVGGVVVAGGATTAAVLLSGGGETTPTGTVVVRF